MRRTAELRLAALRRGVAAVEWLARAVEDVPLLRHDDHHSLSSDSGGGVASLLTAPVVLFGFMIHQQVLLKLRVLYAS
jgi:hypothetical protein